MKKILSFALIGIIILSAIFAYFFLKYMPQREYRTLISKGISSDLIELRKLEKGLLKGRTFHALEAEGAKDNFDSGWKSYHFENFMIDLPSKHPLYQVTPLIKSTKEGQTVEVGLTFNRQSSDFLFDFILEKPFKFKSSLTNSRIFNLPLTKRRISSVSLEVIWKDLFLYDLTAVERLKPLDLVYPLAIAKLREQNLALNAMQIEFLDERRVGIIHVKSSSSKVGTIQLLYLEKGLIYPIKIKYKLWDSIALSLVNRFIQNTNLKLSDKTSALEIYGSYQRLSYMDKTEQLGMIYLFSAWTHDKERENFLISAIRYLERGRSNIAQLLPLYEYAFKKYGSNFSSSKMTIQETRQAELKRKILIETNSEIERYRGSSEFTKDPIFSNEEERIEYYLKKSKESPAESTNLKKLELE